MKTLNKIEVTTLVNKWDEKRNWTDKGMGFGIVHDFLEYIHGQGYRIKGSMKKRIKMEVLNERTKTPRTTR